jgi:glycosyltransferase involved in cell wall biosynthesis
MQPLTRTSQPSLIFAWSQFGPYHMDRCEALARAFAGRYRILGLEMVSRGEIYAWQPTGTGEAFEKVTLFPGEAFSQVSAWRQLTALLRAALRSRARHVFLCDYFLPQTFIAALALRLCGRRVIIMQDSKFDDKPRTLLREAGKVLLYAPYNAALVAANRSKQYLQFLGFRAERVVIGYDTVSLARVLRLSGSVPAPHGTPFAARHFTVIARFVPQKNLALALDAYALYCARQPQPRRELWLCGAGPLEAALKQRVAREGLSGVRFCGWLGEEGIARALAGTLALILPSIEEPFGLVVNEAIALGLPVLLSEACGARDLLVRSGVNGHLFEPDNAEGLAHFMALLASDEAEWRRLCENTAAFRPLADTEHFVAAVEELLARLERRRDTARQTAGEAPWFARGKTASRSAARD